MDTVTIYHNPRCSNSRGALALLREHGIEPAVVEYLQTPLDVPALRALVRQMGVPVRELVRTKEAVFEALRLGEPGVGDDAVFEAMARHPVLMNRPVVVTPRGALLCRPPERVLELIAR